MGWTKAGIYPDRMYDTEPQTSGYVFRARACYSSLYGDAVTNMKLYISENNGFTYVEKPLNKSGDIYTYTLPYNVNTTSVRYYWKATDSQGANISYPAKANTYDYFTIQRDVAPPSLTVKPSVSYIFSTQTVQKMPVVSAFDFSGIQEVQLMYKINASGTEQTMPYVASSNTADAYLANLNLSNLMKGDTLFYRFKAVDRAQTPNAGYFPTSGWIAVPILGP